MSDKEKNTLIDLLIFEVKAAWLSEGCTFANIDHKKLDVLIKKFDEEKDVNPTFATIIENPYNCFGRKPHRMDFEDGFEYEERLSKWESWDYKHNK